MSTCNFAYSNRCVVVTNEDLEFENHPDLQERRDIFGRNFPSRIIKEFMFWDVVLTYAYYEGACIDFVENKEPWEIVEDYIGYDCAKEDFACEVTRAFDITKEKVDELCAKIDREDECDWVQDAMEAVGNYLAEMEKPEVNKFIDGIKEEYGFEEVGLIGVASNGEGFYSRLTDIW